MSNHTRKESILQIALRKCTLVTSEGLFLTLGSLQVHKTQVSVTDSSFLMVDIKLHSHIMYAAIKKADSPLLELIQQKADGMLKRFPKPCSFSILHTLRDFT